MQKLRVMFLYGSPTRTGGHHRSGLAVLKRLQEEGHHVTVVSPGAVKEMIEEIQRAGAEYVAVPEMKDLFKARRKPYFPIMAGYGRIKHLARDMKIDIIHAQDFMSLPRGYMAAIRLRKSFVFTQAGGPNTPRMGPKDSDTVLFSRENLDYHKRRGRKHLHLIRARIDTTEYKPGPVDESFIGRHSLPASGTRIFVASRLQSFKTAFFKSITETARIFASTPASPKIFVAGEGALLPQLREEARQINSTAVDGPVLSFIGPVYGSEEMNQFYNYADIVVGSGRGILEAMACGKAVVIIGANNESEIVDSKSLDDIAYYNFSGRHFKRRTTGPRPLPDLLLELAEDTDRLQQLGEYSLNFIRTEMDAQLGARQLLDVYEKANARKAALADFFIWYADVVGHTIAEFVRKKIFRRRT